MDSTSSRNNKSYLLDNIKNNYTLKRIFNYLKENKSLKIIKYNKDFQKKLNVNLNFYKKIYYQIEIELIPIKNISEKNKFIDREVGGKCYYHGYLNDNKEESQKNYFTKDENIKKIKIIIDYEVTSFNGLFNECNCLEKISFIKFKGENIIDMGKMFRYCENLKELNLNSFNTNNVTNMDYMFFECSSLKELDLRKFNTFKVKDMSSMFQGCRSLKKLELKSFNTSNVTDMSYMFENCIYLTELNLSSFNTKKVTNMNRMFYNCHELEILNIINFNTSSVIDMSYMFYLCSSLKELYLNNLKINDDVYLSQMFFGSSNELKDIIKEINPNINEEAFSYY